MTTYKESWTPEHDLALVYVSLAYGTDQELTDYELATITDVLSSWRSEFQPDEVQEVVMEAVSVYLEDGAEDAVLHAIDNLRGHLTEDQRRRALEDVVRIAEADGVLLSSERNLISALADQWNVKGDARRLLRKMTAPDEGNAAWTLLHDVGLMYVVMGHSTDNKLSDKELAVMLSRLQAWQPELDEQEARSVLREVLTFYSGEPGKDVLQDAVGAIREMLPVVQRLAILDDLTQIGKADGHLGKNEQDMLESLSRAWGLSVRIQDGNGSTGEDA